MEKTRPDALLHQAKVLVIRGIGIRLIFREHGTLCLVKDTSTIGWPLVQLSLYNLLDDRSGNGTDSRGVIVHI